MSKTVGESPQAVAKDRLERLTEQRKGLPDGPGVYLFKDGEGEVLYVGKAKSIRKRVASHFAKPSTRGTAEMTLLVTDIECVVVNTEAEALLAEQEFIKLHRPRFNIRLRDDKSYPYIGISLDEDYPRIYFTRERHRRDRAYFGPFSNAKRVRQTLDLLGKIFQYRTCEGAEPGRQSGNPCLDYHLKRCQAPCVGYVSKEEYRRNVETIMDFLSGRYRQIENELEQSMRLAAADQEFEAAAHFRNKLRAVQSLLERQQVSSQTTGTLDAIAIAVEEGDANAQVFQVRDGVLAGRQGFYLQNADEGDEAEVLEEFVLQYYSSAFSIPPQVVVPQLGDRAEVLADVLSARRGASVEVRQAERGDKRKLLDLARRNARLALDQDRLRTEHRRSRRIEALEGLQRSLEMGVLPMRIECFDISNIGPSHTVASMVVFEGGEAKKAHYRHFKINTAEEDDYAAMREVLSRRVAQFRAQRELSPHEKEHDASFAALPALVVIDGGKGQLSAGLPQLEELRLLGTTVISLAKQIEEVFIPGRPDPLLLRHDSAPLQLLQRVRDEAHRFAIEFHRRHRDRYMTRSFLDDVPGVGRARKQAILSHFGTPERVLVASREELEAVPGLQGKVARDIHAHLHRVD